MTTDKIICSFNNTITERGRDLLLAETISMAPVFFSILLNKTGLSGRPFRVRKVDVSISDSDLGEPDITVVVA